ncbi:EpsG-like putative glucosyltransferase [Cereibacter changlensis]|nr:EpsG-like putative glucosyltransferase [Cereibacter changlensis]
MKSSGWSKIYLSMFLISIAFGFSAGYGAFGESRDYFSYNEFFSQLRPGRIFANFRFEPGFVFSTWVAKFALGLELPATFSLLMSAALLLKSHSFSRAQHPILTMLFYLATWYPLHEYTQVRVAMATAFLFAAVNCFFANKRMMFILCGALAVSFHGSAIFALACVLTAHSLAPLRLRFSIPLLLGLSLSLSIILKSSMLPIMAAINPLTSAYITLADGFEVPTIFSGANILTVAFLVLFYKASGFNSPRHRTLFLVTVASLMVFVALRDVPVMAHRLKEITLVFVTLLAFDYKISPQRVPQAAVAFGLATWSLYKAVTLGVI